MAYVKILYQDSPSTATPINAQNLNHMDDQIALNDQRLTELEGAHVSSFNGRTGDVAPESGDYSAEQITYGDSNVGTALDNLASTKADSATTLSGYGITDAYTKTETDAEIANIGTFTASGESFALTPTSEGNVLAHSIYGMSEQDGTPTPSSPVDIASSKADFRCVGKNINSYPYYQTTRTVGGITWTDNGDGTVTANGTATDNSALICHSRGTTSINKLIIPNGTYILSGCPNGGVSNTYYINAIVTQNGSAVSLGQDFGEGVEITINGDDNYTDRAQLQIACNIRTNYTASNLTFKPMLTLKGTDQTYEPHKHTDITTDLTLRTIEVSSTDRYNLVRDGKYYIADTVDWNEDNGYVLTRRIAHIDIDGTEDGWEIASASTSEQRYSLVNFYITKGTGLPLKSVNCSVSNRLLNTSGRGGAWGTFYFGGANPTFRTIVINDGGSTPQFNSLSDFTTWVGNNPISVDYILATPTKTSLTSEQAQSLLSLKTYDVSTSINAQASPEPTVELEYAKSQTTALALSGHNVSRINALKIVDLNTALIELGGN